MKRMVQLEPGDAAVRSQIIRIGKELGNLALRTSKPLATIYCTGAGLEDSYGGDPIEGFGAVAPRIGIFVDLGWQTGYVEEVRFRAPKFPRSTAGAINAHSETEGAPGRTVGGNIEGEFGVYLALSAMRNKVGSKA